jgi:hypothetical protein
MKTFFEAIGLTGVTASIGYVLIVAVWIAAIVFAISAIRRDQTAGAEGQPA